MVQFPPFSRVSQNGQSFYFNTSAKECIEQRAAILCKTQLTHSKEVQVILRSIDRKNTALFKGNMKPMTNIHYGSS